MSYIDSIPPINLNILSEDTLQKYIEYYKIPTSKMTKRSELVKIISDHLNQICVDETEVLNSFMENLEVFREEQKRSIDEAKKEESKRRIKRNKRYNHDNDDMMMDNIDTPAPKFDDGDFEETKDKEKSYCICGKTSYGKMIECDNRDCPIGWFHYECLGLPPDYVIPESETWYCPKCRPLFKKD